MVSSEGRGKGGAGEGTLSRAAFVIQQHDLNRSVNKGLKMTRVEKDKKRKENTKVKKLQAHKRRQLLLRPLSLFSPSKRYPFFFVFAEEEEEA